ncbi:hypothetical protein pipiens_018942, partial [Culex pipiens pipiens]
PPTQKKGQEHGIARVWLNMCPRKRQRKPAVVDLSEKNFDDKGRVSEVSVPAVKGDAESMSPSWLQYNFMGGLEQLRAWIVSVNEYCFTEQMV